MSQGKPKEISTSPQIGIMRFGIVPTTTDSPSLTICDPVPEWPFGGEGWEQEGLEGFVSYQVGD